MKRFFILFALVVDEKPPAGLIGSLSDSHTHIRVSFLSCDEHSDAPASRGSAGGPRWRAGGVVLSCMVFGDSFFYAHASHPGRTFLSVKSGSRSAAAVWGVRITCSARAIACLQTALRYMASGQEQKLCPSLRTTPYYVPSPFVTKPRISASDCAATVML